MDKMMNKIKIYIWGSGFVSDKILSSLEKNIESIYDNDIFYVAGIIDNDDSKWGKTFHGKQIVSPQNAIDSGFDQIIILIANEQDVIMQAQYAYGIKTSSIKGKNGLLKLALLLKYDKCEDPEIKETIEYLKENELTLFNNWLPERKLVEVFWDGSINLPYVSFQDVIGVVRKMYFPWQLCNRFTIKDGKQYYLDMNYEQLQGSPHLYTYQGHDVKEGDVVIDGGVCEGNFSLKYAAIVGKMYLFEPDPLWAKANYYTFRAFDKKIIRSNKMLSNKCNDIATTIDSLGLKRLDFIKLDIEGAELDALIGGEKTLLRNNTTMSVCTYHNSEDAELIESYLTKIGYGTEYSKGNMIFTFDNNIWNSLDIRKCLIYAKKIK